MPQIEANYRGDGSQIDNYLRLPAHDHGAKRETCDEGLLGQVRD